MEVLRPRGRWCEATLVRRADDARAAASGWADVVTSPAVYGCPHVVVGPQHVGEVGAFSITGQVVLWDRRSLLNTGVETRAGDRQNSNTELLSLRSSMLSESTAAPRRSG